MLQKFPNIHFHINHITAHQIIPAKQQYHQHQHPYMETVGEHSSRTMIESQMMDPQMGTTDHPFSSSGYGDVRFQQRRVRRGKCVFVCKEIEKSKLWSGKIKFV